MDAVSSQRIGDQTMEFNYITHGGIALDDFGNEVRDEDGAIIVVPDDERANYVINYPYE